MAEDIVERLRAAEKLVGGGLYDEAADEIERLREALERIQQWADAYPLDIFPEPDFKKAHEVLTAHGMTLDAISASNMRHVINGVRGIVDAALKTP